MPAAEATHETSEQPIPTNKSANVEQLDSGPSLEVVMSNLKAKEADVVDLTVREAALVSMFKRL